jgi:hypothetical protein
VCRLVSKDPVLVYGGHCDLASPRPWVLKVALKSLDTEGSSSLSTFREAAEGCMINLFGDEIRTAAC